MLADGLGDGLASFFAPPTARDLAEEPYYVHIYVRVSSPEQTKDRGKGKGTAEEHKDELSPATQEQVCRDWVAERVTLEITGGRRVVVIVHVEAFTSRVLWGRPVFAQVMAEIAAGRVDLLLCLKPERLGANSEQQAILRCLLRHKGGDLAYVEKTFEDTAVGRIMAVLWAEFNTMRLESLREQFRRRQLARVDGGRVLHSSHPPYACAWAEEPQDAYVFVPELTPWVVRIFEWFADGKSKKAIARQLNDLGVPPPGGGKGWYDRSVDVILDNPIYVGRPQSYRYVTDVLPGFTKTGKLRRRTRYRTEADEEQPREATKGLAPGEVPPVSQTLWQRVLDRKAAVAAGRDQVAKGGRRPVADDDWLLRGGFITCGSCEGSLQCSTTGGTDGTKIYVCRANGNGVTNCARPTSISKHLAEERVWEQIVRFTKQPEVVERVLAHYEASLTGDGGAGAAAGAAAARAEASKCQREAAGLMPKLAGADAFKEQLINDHLDGLKHRLERLREEAEQLEAQAAEQARAVGERVAYVEAVRRIGTNLEKPAGEWPAGLRRLAVVGTRVQARVYPSVKGRAARSRPVDALFEVDRGRWATLAEILEEARREGPDTGGSANGHLRHFAASRKNAPPAALRLRLAPDGGLAVAP